jgi:hypothetical protein
MHWREDSRIGSILLRIFPQAAALLINSWITDGFRGQAIFASNDSVRKLMMPEAATSMPVLSNLKS